MRARKQVSKKRLAWSRSVSYYERAFARQLQRMKDSAWHMLSITVNATARFKGRIWVISMQLFQGSLIIHQRSNQKRSRRRPLEEPWVELEINEKYHSDLCLCVLFIFLLRQRSWKRVISVLRLGTLCFFPVFLCSFPLCPKPMEELSYELYHQAAYQWSLPLAAWISFIMQLTTGLWFIHLLALDFWKIKYEEPRMKRPEGYVGTCLGFHFLCWIQSKKM